VYEVPCPHCGAQLSFDEKSAGRKTKCPTCREKITIPQPRRSKVTSWIAFVDWCVGFIFLVSLGLSIWLGIQWGLFIVAVIIALILSDRQARNAVRDGINRLEVWRRARFTTPNESPLSLTENRSGTTSPPRSKSRPLSERDAAKRAKEIADELLVEIQNSTIAPAPGAAVPGNSTLRSPTRQTIPTGTASIFAIKFYGAGETLALERGQLQSPLVYAVAGTLPQPYEPSLIEFGLPVTRPGIQPGQEPADWASYRAFNPTQRACYLQWIASDRRQPDIPRPYVNLYLQGLERRIVRDGQDHQAIAVELIGLLSTYQTVVAFRRDLTSLLWLTISLSVDVQPVSQETVDSAIQHTIDWNETLLRYCLATFAQMQWKISPTLARTITTLNPRATSSVVHQRHAEKFSTLFDKRLDEAFPDGLRFELSGRAERLDYVCLNPALVRLPRSETRLGARQRVANDHPQLQALVTLWGRCTDELRSYDRAHRAAEGGTLTTEMWEALPEVSRDQDHPEAAAWSELIQQGSLKFGCPLVPIASLAKIKKFEQRGRLTKRQVEQLLTTASNLQLAIEPDARMLGRNYAWNETVAIFPRRDDSPEDLANYHAASILLRLGVNIAAADGTIDDLETQRITSHLSQQFALSATSVDRLEHLRFALIHSPSLVETLEKSLQEKLKPDQRQVVGEFLVGIAASDGFISTEELKALKKAWQALGLEPASLDALLTIPSTGADSALEPASESIVLDQDRIAQIMQDTQRVAEMLRAAMSEDGDHESDHSDEVERSLEFTTAASGNHQAEVASTPIDDTPVATRIETPSLRETAPEHIATARFAPPTIENSHTTTPALWTGLPARYQDLLRSLLTKPIWNRQELDQLARSHGLMLSGALEAINEWVYEIHSDWLTTEDGDEIQVQTGLL